VTWIGGPRILLCCVVAAVLFLPTYEEAVWAQSASTAELKTEIVEYFKLYRRSPSRKWYEGMRTKGDLYPAALEILREDEKLANQNLSTGLTTVALSLMRYMIQDGDSRPYDVMLPYLDSPQGEGRWITVVDCVITFQHEGGEERIRKYLESYAGGDRQKYLKVHILGAIQAWGGAHWLPFLKRMNLTPEDKNDVVGYTLKSTIETLEKKYPGQPDSRSPSPAPGSGPSVGHSPETPIQPAIPEAARPPDPDPQRPDGGRDPATDAGSDRRAIKLGVGVAVAILVVALGLLWKSRRGISGRS
jgi:hypothetical protein